MFFLISFLLIANFSTSLSLEILSSHNFETILELKFKKEVNWKDGKQTL